MAVQMPTERETWLRALAEAEVQNAYNDLRSPDEGNQQRAREKIQIYEQALFDLECGRPDTLGQLLGST